jgi:pyruvate/2-oxoglutarate dehydrogenase complex dihydrolipoamide acyltransferase (E2) component
LTLSALGAIMSDEMKRIVFTTVGVAAFSAWAGPARSAEHLVTGAEATVAVAQVADERAAEVAAVQAVLSTPAAVRAATSMGVSLDRVRAAVPTLTDGELRDLAARAAAVQSDPAAGHLDPWVNDVLIVVLIVGIVLLVLNAV